MRVFTIKRKFLTLLSISLISMVAITAFALFTLGEVEKSANVRIMVEALKSDLLMLRRNEKDFIVRKKIEYIARYRQNSELLEKHSAAIKDYLEDKDLETTEITKYADKISQYNKKFFQYCSLQQQVGLDSNDALNAKIYSDTKKIESLLLESSSQLQLLAFSELNVHFKDFLFSHSLVSIENFKNHLLQIKEIFLKTTNMSDVDKKVLLTTLQSYKNNIFNLVSIEVKKGLNEQSGIHRQMRKLAHEVEGIQEHMLSEYKDLLTFENDKLKLKLLLMIIIVMLFSIIGATLFANKITDNIKKLEYGLLDFFEYLNKKKKRVPRININSDDEIGVMANLINDNISKAIEMLKYERKSTKFIQDVNQEIIDTQKELLNTVGTISETRSRETGQHVKRVALYSKLLAKKLNLPKKEINLIELASPMHDIGKIGIPDSILNKPGKLTKDEFEIMKTHAQIGFDMLKHSKREIIQAAAVIAYEHHEKYDGSGYPNARVGEQIHIFGRITALADVFDALGSDRCYKEAWELDRILAFIKDERGKHFDPKLVDIFFDNLDEFLDIQRRYKEVNVEEKLLV